MPETVCPRCHGPLELPGTSRVTIERTIRICGDCCTDEAVRDANGRSPVPPSEWPLANLTTWAPPREA